jgi:hypothetical protein
LRIDAAVLQRKIRKPPVIDTLPAVRPPENTRVPVKFKK